ncbi:hypothetical protein EXIGLDRAFT_372852 [Exidia glandulosa HHB12029]|uniref:Uncharacterized protein n=1 Tax=Exidia glandulosa HHB12029 TaxID=1314781 RepID=A0A165PX54_EXIGL|nr:hypothetical protein EXIGLDRAFT_372852 [Exidia glandulosa HHB12029]
MAMRTALLNRMTLATLVDESVGDDALYRRCRNSLLHRLSIYACIPPTHGNQGRYECPLPAVRGDIERNTLRKTYHLGRRARVITTSLLCSLLMLWRPRCMECQRWRYCSDKALRAAPRLRSISHYLGSFVRSTVTAENSWFVLQEMLLNP